MHYEPIKVIELVESIKLIFYKQVFNIIKGKAMKDALLQHYFVSFSFFIAICKQNSFKKIQDYCTYKLFYTEMLQRNIFAMVEFLSSFFKMKVLEKIFNYSQREYFRMTITFIMNTLIKPYLKQAFENIKNNIVDKKANIEEIESDSKKKNEVEEVSKNEIISKIVDNDFNKNENGDLIDDQNLDIIKNRILKNNEKKLINNTKNTKTNTNTNVENRYKDINLCNEDENNSFINYVNEDNENEKKKNTDLIRLKLKNEQKEISEQLTNEIINNILFSEIKGPNIKIIPNKSLKNQILFSNIESSYLHNNLRRDFTSLEDLSFSFSDSIMSFSNFSIFNKTIKDKKKENSVNFYIKSIAPRLIKLIREEIFENYSRIYNNISKPLIMNSSEIMKNLKNVKDNELMKLQKYPDNIEKISDIINKDKILKKFEPINKKLRLKDNILIDNYYDNFLNECIIETVIDIIEGERLYGKDGEPLKWSNRKREISLKYDENDPKKLADFVIEELINILQNKIGLINDNYDNLNTDQVDEEKKKRLSKLIKNEIKESDYMTENFELIEAKIKIELTDTVLERIIHETVEILEHIRYSRERSDLYQNKSIYACSSLPKLKTL